MKVALTGHRPERLQGQENEISKWIKERLTSMDCEEVYSGMARGADRMFAKVAQELDIPVVCCYPYRKNFFDTEEKEIMRKAKRVHFEFAKYPGNRAYWMRDKMMVDNCDVLLAVWDGKKTGGTWITVQYAQKIGKPIIYYQFKEDQC